MLIKVLLGFFTWFWVVQALYGPFKAMISLSLLKRQKHRLQAAAIGARENSVALIVAAKGVTQFFDRFLELVTRQNYSDYRILFVTQSEDDPARIAIAEYLGLGPGETVWKSTASKGLREVQLVVAGLAEDEGQKVHNQLAAFEYLQPEDEIIAFADADIVGSKSWLEEMVTPLNVRATELSTGYRWFVPEKMTFPNIVATNINRGIAMLAGPHWHTLLWGGSMALTRKAFDDLKVPEILKGSLNDDLQISYAAYKAGKPLLFVRTLMAPSPIDYDWESLFEFGRRQYFQVRTYVPGYWFSGLALTGIWLAGAITTWTKLFMGYAWNLVPIGIVIACLVGKHFLELPYLKLLFPEETVAKLRKTSQIGLFTNPINFVIHFGVIASTVFMKEITWAGIKYRVGGRQETEVLGRS